MPDDQNVPVGGAGQTHAARVKFASGTVREKVGDLLAEAAAPLNLLPLLTLLLAACGKAAPDIAGRPDAEDGAEEDRSKEDGERAAYRRIMNSPPCASSLSSRMAPARGPSGTTATSRMRPICPSRMTCSDSGSPSAPSITR